MHMIFQARMYSIQTTNTQNELYTCTSPSLFVVILNPRYLVQQSTFHSCLFAYSLECTAAAMRRSNSRTNSRGEKLHVFFCHEKYHYPITGNTGIATVYYSIVCDNMS